MKTIRLMADYFCFPLWHDGGQVGNIDPQSLQLSAELIQKLDLWATQYDTILNQEYPPDSKFESPEAEMRFEYEGINLWKQLQKALSGEYKVIYFSRLINKEFGNLEELLNILTALKDEKLDGMKKKIIYQLGEQKEERALPVLMALFSDKDKSLRQPAAMAVGQFGLPAIKFLLELWLEDRCLKEIDCAMSMVQDEEVTKYLLVMSQNDNDKLRAFAAKYLYSRDPLVIKRLAELARDDKNITVRNYAQTHLDFTAKPIKTLRK